MLESSCIRSTTCFPLNRATLSLVILDYFSATYMLGGIFQLIPTSVSETGIISDGPKDTRSAGGKIIIPVDNVWRGMNMPYQRRILVGLQGYCPWLTN